MALTNINIVRYGIGDVILPYKLTDAQITDYLALYDDNTDDTIAALMPVMLAILAATGGKDVIGDFERDTKDSSKNYLAAMKYAISLSKDADPITLRGYPIVGGTVLDDSIAIGMFTDDDF